MRKIVTTFLFLFLFIPNCILYPQGITANLIAIKSFSINVDTNKRKHKWLGWRWKNKKPFIELNYGLGEPNQKNLISVFSRDGLLEIKLGFNSNEKVDSCNVLEINEHFILGSKASPSIYKNPNKRNEVKANLLRLGFAKRDGYGYNFNAVSVLLYHQTGFTWSQFDFKDYPTYLTNYPKSNSFYGPINDIEILNKYNKQTRFGTLAESGIRLDLQSSISFNVGYETSVVFSRHLFWKHAASYLLESFGSHSLDYFIDRVLDTSPNVAPIVNFILKNAYSYGWYLLKKDKMNWPFNTESPIAVEFFKAGITFTF